MPEIAAHPSQIDQFEDIIDVRSPMEFSKDHIQGSQNFPVLNDAERDYIGKIFNNESKFKAKKVGAALVAKNISVILEKNFINKSREWRPLIYCWRGGNCSCIRDRWKW